MKLIVDFHVHSTASDGTLTPSELWSKAKDFAAIALTDHDNTDGIPQWPGVSGVELSIEPGSGFDKFHLLALGVDCNNTALKSFLRRILEGRNERNEKIIANFQRLGIAIERSDIMRYAHGEVLARPHFARWLVEHGYAQDIKTAFARYLLSTSPDETRCYESRYRPSQAETFAVVHNAGGLCVMAHPKYWRRDWENGGLNCEVARHELARLKEMGLDGIEALYRANTLEEDIAFTRLANEVGLVKSAGSDFHGANKPQIPLGMTVDDLFIGELFERLGISVRV